MQPIIAGAAQVYTWLLGVHKVSVFAGLAGYLITFLELLGLVALLAKPLGGLGLVLAWYGLFFGILNRDAAEVASNRMARPAGLHAVRGLAAGTKPRPGPCSC